MSTASASITLRQEDPAGDARMRISLPQIAGLAKVRRPVVSMWRSRFESGADAFPQAVDVRAGREYFDAVEVAHWLVDTSHGNNPDAVADAAAFAMPESTQNTDATRNTAIEALLALRVSDGERLTTGDLSARAHQADPANDALLDEVLSVADDADLASFVEQMIDAAYSPRGAWDALQSQTRRPSSTGIAGDVSPVGTDFIARLALSLADPENVALVDCAGALSSGELFTSIADRCDDATDLHVPTANRTVRRQLMVHGRAPMLIGDAPHPARSAVWVARLRGISPASELAQLEELLVELSDNQRLVVVGPDSLLVEPLDGVAATSREYALRSGRVRGIVRLPEGLVPTATRQSLAIWVVGGPQGGTPLADRFTVVGDLRGTSLTSARMQDLVSDLAVSLGTVREAMSHSFRFVRFVRTSTLLAGSTSLVTAGRLPHPYAIKSPAELSALVDQKLAALEDTSLTVRLQSSSQKYERTVSLANAVAAREARVLSGARLDADDTTSDEGYPVLGRDEVRAGAASARLIDRVRVAVGYPRAQLTLPGDVIFVTGPKPAALVDHDGSSVVEYPARILRLFDETLVPEVAAADINLLTEAVPWRRWILRRVPAGQKAALQTALADIAEARRAAEQRAFALRELETLVTDAVAAGALVNETTDETSEMTDPEGTT